MVYRQICDELKKKAKEELNEDPDKINSDLEYIKDWLKSQSYIKARTDDQWLLAFLRHAKFSLERSKKKLDIFYTMRTMIPEFFKNRDIKDPKIYSLFQRNTFLPIVQSQDLTVPSTIVLKPGLFDPRTENFYDICKLSFMALDVLLLQDDSSQINGINIIYDVEGITMAHDPGPIIFKKSVTAFTKAYPFRIKGIHYVNMSPIFDLIFGLIKSFLPKKLKNRTYIHSNWESLQKHIPKCALPKEYGGELSLQILTDKFNTKFEENKDWFLEEDQYGTVEKLRPGKPINSGELFGVEGSFRKLTID